MLGLLYSFEIACLVWLCDTLRGRIMRKRLFIFGCLLVWSFLFLCCGPVKKDFDILIVKGTIVDGSGKPGFQGDIGISGDIIVAIGDLSGKTAQRIIDAETLVVSPGFIDMHTHCDAGLGEQESCANLNYLIQGTTTVVTGNCGGGTYKIAETKAEWENQGIGTNAIHLIGFGDVRRAVMGNEPRDPTTQELEEIKAIVRQAMKEGAWGMSTGLEYIPDMYAPTEEIIAVTATRETIRIAKETGVRANISHLKICGKNNWGMMDEVIQVINDARNSGIPITADMYPYDKAATGPLIAITTNSGWSCFRLPENMQPFTELRVKMNNEELTEEKRADLKRKYIEELEKALKDKAKREEIRRSVLFGVPHNPSPIAVSGWDSYAVVAAKKNTHLIDEILSDLALEQQRDAFDIAAELVVEEPDLYLSCGALSEEDMKKLMTYEWLMFSSDGGARPVPDQMESPRPGHPRSFGSQARVLRKYVREEKVLSLEEAVRKMTSLPSQYLQLKDRGLLMEGYKADVIVFDPQTIRDNATYANPRQYSTGTDFVLVNGEISVEKGEYTGVRNGKLLLLTENR
jgi:N-acyl-D-amino-acid deacylase